MYVCGPTVYGPPHLGHGRFDRSCSTCSAVTSEWTGLEVTYVSNVTDIDDKIIKRANAEGRDRPRDRRPSTRRSGARRWTPSASSGPTDTPTPPPTSSEMVALIGELVDAARRLRDDRRRLLLGRAASPTTGCSPASRSTSLRGGGAPRVEGNEEKRSPGRLRAVEEGQAGRAVVAVAVGRRPTRAGTPSAS